MNSKITCNIKWCGGWSSQRGLISVDTTFVSTFGGRPVRSDLPRKYLKYVNIRRFHWIMLRIMVDKSLIEVYDPLNRDEPFDDMKAMLHK